MGSESLGARKDTHLTIPLHLTSCKKQQSSTFISPPHHFSAKPGANVEDDIRMSFSCNPPLCWQVLSE